jgi:hypothetical protein
MYLTFFSSSSDTFQSNSLVFDEFDYGAFCTEEVDFNFETYLPAPLRYLHRTSSRAFFSLSSCLEVAIKVSTWYVGGNNCWKKAINHF